jgi:hypothetical protein
LKCCPGRIRVGSGRAGLRWGGPVFRRWFWRREGFVKLGVTLPSLWTLFAAQWANFSIGLLGANRQG